MIMSAKSLVIGVFLVCAAGAAQAATSGCTFEPRIPSTRYEVKGAEVFDKETNLTWQRCSVGQEWKEGAGCVGEVRELSRAEARKTPANWRLPTKEELDGLLS